MPFLPPNQQCQSTSLLFYKPLPIVSYHTFVPYTDGRCQPKQVAAVLTAKGRIVAATYRTGLEISTVRRIFPVLGNGPRDVPQIAPSARDPGLV